jgi:hypothetical protein
VSGYLLRSRPEEAPPRAAPKGRALAFDLMADLYGNSAERSWKSQALGSEGARTPK